MKRLMLTVLVMLCLCLPAQGDIYSWIWGDNDAIGARVGTDITENVEAGLSALWFPDRERPEIWGVYGVYHLPEIIAGRPYLGGKLDIDFNLHKVGEVSPIAGIVFVDILFIEYQFESFDRKAKGESKIVFGLRIEF